MQLLQIESAGIYVEIKLWLSLSYCSSEKKKTFIKYSRSHIVFELGTSNRNLYFLLCVTQMEHKQTSGSLMDFQLLSLTLKLGTGMTPETLVIFNQLTRLLTQEHFVYSVSSCSVFATVLVLTLKS
jgi:hypothetical protein